VALNQQEYTNSTQTSTGSLVTDCDQLLKIC